MSELWIATGNAKKRRELERLLGPMGIRLRGLDEAPQPVTIVEDQPNFAGNARIKAAALAQAVGAAAIGDDSGLSVEALGGRPGVLSARYAGPDASDTDRITKLLEELAAAGEPERTARFTCCIVLCGPDGTVRAEIEEHCAGTILGEARGTSGFGYDPVFVAADSPAEDGVPPTFAQLSPEQKDEISHRGKALRRLVTLLHSQPELLETRP